MTSNSELAELIPHASVVQTLSVELCNITKKNALTAIKSFVDSKIKDTIQYINKRIQDKIKSEPTAIYVLIKNSDVFNLWEPKLSPEELLEYNQYYNILRCNYTVCTGLTTQCNATASTPNSRPPGVGVEFSVGGTKIALHTYKYGDQFAQTKNDMVKSVLEEAFKLYHKQGYLTQWCWNNGGSSFIDCFDIIWKEN